MIPHALFSPLLENNMKILLITLLATVAINSAVAAEKPRFLECTAKNGTQITVDFRLKTMTAYNHTEKLDVSADGNAVENMANGDSYIMTKEFTNMEGMLTVLILKYFDKTGNYVLGSLNAVTGKSQMKLTMTCE